MRNRDGHHSSGARNFSGSYWLDKAWDLIHQGNLKRLTLRRPNGRLLIDVPLLAGLSIIAILVLIVPTLMALAALTALVMRFSLEIERDTNHSNYCDQDD